MIDQRLFTYIEQELKRGVPDVSVKKALRETGWPEDAIKKAFAIVQSRAEPPHPEIDVPEDQIVRGGKMRRPKRSGKKLPLRAILFVTFVLVALAGAWYYFIIWPEQKEAAEIQNLLDSQSKAPAETQDPNSGSSPDSVNILPATTSPDASAGNAVPDQLTGIGDPASSGAAALVENADGGANNSVEGADPVATRDGRRRAELDQLAAAQKLWFTEHGKYYTCGLSGGDCGGKAYGFPAQVGIYLAQTTQDALMEGVAQKAVCGTDYVYCGLNNASYSNFFCYYAKLEAGGYYVVSHAGAATRTGVPKVFEDCAVSN